MLGLGVRRKPGPSEEGKPWQPWQPWKQLLGKSVMDPHRHAICVGSGSRAVQRNARWWPTSPTFPVLAAGFGLRGKSLGSDPVDQFPSTLFPQLTLNPRCDVEHDPLCHLANSETYAFLACSSLLSLLSRLALSYNCSFRQKPTEGHDSMGTTQATIKRTSHNHPSFSMQLG
jgi:hypothetical protein